MHFSVLHCKYSKPFKGDQSFTCYQQMSKYKSQFTCETKQKKKQKKNKEDLNIEVILTFMYKLLYCPVVFHRVSVRGSQESGENKQQARGELPVLWPRTHPATCPPKHLYSLPGGSTKHKLRVDEIS